MMKLRKGGETMFTKEIKRFGEICCKTQLEVKRYLYSVLVSNGYKPVSEDGFIYAKGELPFLVTAHMDTVHKNQCKRYSIHRFKGKHRIQSKDGIGGDDRCGIWMIVRMVLDGYRPSILFCEDEEIGSIGARKFCRTQYVYDLMDLNYLIELDRANENDAVFYECDNPEFTKYITEKTGYEEAIGSFSDIVELSETCRIASVNFSCGYYKPHTTQEYVIFEEMDNTLKVVESLLRDKECKQYEFIEKQYNYYKGMFDDGWYGYGYGTSSYTSNNMSIEGLEIMYGNYIKDENGEIIYTEEYDFAFGETINECLGEFFIRHPQICYDDILDYTPC